MRRRSRPTYETSTLRAEHPSSCDQIVQWDMVAHDIGMDDQLWESRRVLLYQIETYKVRRKEVIKVAGSGILSDFYCFFIAEPIGPIKPTIELLATVIVPK